MTKEFAQERKFIKNASIAYAISYYKNKSIDLTKIFTQEGLRMIEKYTFLRRQLVQRDEQLRRAAMKSINNESIIMELRQFIEENLEPAMLIIEQQDKHKQRSKYINPNRNDPMRTAMGKMKGPGKKTLKEEDAEAEDKKL